MNNDFAGFVRDKSIATLSGLYKQYGVDERSLGWTKNKQHTRFEHIASRMDVNGASILDVGFGFADLYDHLKTTRPDASFEYTGIDIMPDFIEVSKQKFPGLSLYCTDLFSFKPDRKYKYLVNCGCLTYLDPRNEKESYEYIDVVIGKNLELCEDDGICIFHFLTDKVDYRTSEEDFHCSPEKMLGIAFRHSRRVVLDNSVFPFEACLFIYKDDSYKTENTTFTGALQ